MKKNRGTAATPAILFVLFVCVLFYWLITSQQKEYEEKVQMENEIVNQEKNLIDSYVNF